MLIILSDPLYGDTQANCRYHLKKFTQGRHFSPGAFFFISHPVHLDSHLMVLFASSYKPY